MSHLHVVGLMCGVREGSLCSEPRPCVDSVSCCGSLAPLEIASQTPKGRMLSAQVLLPLVHPFASVNTYNILNVFAHTASVLTQI